MSTLVLIGWLCIGFWLIRRDTAHREGISAATWIPTLWVGILASRPLSMWLGTGGGIDSLEGSPMDRSFYLAMILMSWAVLARRNVKWGQLIGANWPVLLFYGYFLASTIWADSTLVSFKRWFKDFGNVFVALVILTEVNPGQAFRAVFIRCAYMWIPLSVVFIRYFPELGRRYSSHSGLMEATGVSVQKNSLGMLVLVCCLVVIWDWFEAREHKRTLPLIERHFPKIIVCMGVYLLHVCDSKTSTACLALGAAILATSRVPMLRLKISKLGTYGLVGGLIFFGIDRISGLSEWIVASMGRDMTFTGRTDIWRELLALDTNPLVGTGFCSFWDQQYVLKLPDWVPASAHNGYLETYIVGGWIGVAILAIMLLGVGIKLNRGLASGTTFSLMRFAVFVDVLLVNFSESVFGMMGAMWFLFIVSVLDHNRDAEPLPAWNEQNIDDISEPRSAIAAT